MGWFYTALSPNEAFKSNYNANIFYQCFLHNQSIPSSVTIIELFDLHFMHPEG
jgi:hypothetical protein